MPKQPLHMLLNSLVEPDACDDRIISGISLDSRTVLPGFLFVGYTGEKTDGRQYIHEAIDRGAVAVVCEGESPGAQREMRGDLSIPIVTIPDLKNKLGLIAAQFYEHPSRAMKVIGITGTNGKTSCSQFIASLLESAGQRCGIIGTVGNGLFGQLQESSLTTPDAMTLQQTLADFYLAGAKAVSMEVSSHALDQGRIIGTTLTTAVLTNLTRDHLDYHGDMTHYAHAKQRLFAMPDLRCAIINLDDSFGWYLLEQIPSSLSVIGYSTTKINAAIRRKIPIVNAYDLCVLENGMCAQIETPWGGGELSTTLLGRFNLSNLLAVIAVLGEWGIPISDLLSHIPKLKGVPGRMEVLGGGKQPWVIVDYAHTPDALKHVLQALREHCRGSICCVFGCGGDRDRGKRPLMAEVVEQYADRMIITDDNPRNENPVAIVADIVRGLSSTAAFVIEHNRHHAISDAIQRARVGDIVLIAGKGHETYQQIGADKFSFSDKLVAQSILGE